MRIIDDATQRSGDVRLRRLVFEMTGYHHSETTTLEEWSAEHDIWWLDLMIRHHRGALEIADAQIAAGGVAAAREMAISVRRVQSGEIEHMETLRDSLCAEQEQQAGTVLTGCA